MKHPGESMRAQSGIGLIELMVAMLIGLFLIFGAVTIYQQSRTTFRTSEALARLQEVARLAFDVLEADLRMGNYWGMHNRAEYIMNKAGPGAGLPAAFSVEQGAALSQCGGTGSNWAINLDEYLGGTDDSYALTCAAFDSAPSATSDTVIIRRAAEAQPVAMDPDRVHVQSSRLQGALFVPAAGCTDPTDPACVPAAYAPPQAQTRELVVHAYYVSTSSTMRDDVPSLRRKTFGNVNAAVATEAITDEEIVPGVEDLQICFGVDTDGDTNIDQYFNPGAVPATAAIISATLWLRVRSEDIEVGHVDGRSYVPAPTDDPTALTQCGAADVTTAFTPNDNFRRIVVSKTIQLRNTRV